jgi:uncharacterized sulfatase
MDRRKFLQRSLLSTLWLWLTGQVHAAEQEKPNILWLTSEDHGPHLGCYGDLYADTPNLDNFAARACCSSAPGRQRRCVPRPALH